MFHHYKNNWKNTIGLMFSLDAGSFSESTNEKGFTHFAEHLTFVQTKKIPNQELNNRFHQIFNYLDAETSREQVKIYCCFDLANFDIAIETLSAMIFEWECPKEFFKREKEILLQEAKKYFKSAEFKQRKEFIKLLPLPTDGPLADLKTLKKFSINDIPKIKKHWQKILKKEKSVNVISGKLTESQIQNIQKSFRLKESELNAKSGAKALTHSKFSISKTDYKNYLSASALFFKSNHFHLCSLLLNEIYSKRFKKNYECIQIKNLTAFLHFNPKTNSDLIKKTFLKAVSQNEFNNVKFNFIKEFKQRLDVVDIFDSLHWLNGFYQNPYAPIFSTSPQKNLQYFEKLTYNEFKKFFYQITDDLC